MKTVEFLKANGKDFSKLTESFGIKVKTYEDILLPTLYVLNYDQIESPKTDPIVMECRGLILDDNLDIICRPFDRFFNYGEAGIEKEDFRNYTFYPKLDGSLIKVYHWHGMWRIATRGTAFAEAPVGSWGITFEQLALKAFGCKSLKEFDDLLSNKLQFNVGMTYLFELTAPENRVVTPYTERSVTLLAVRDCKTGDYLPTQYVDSFGSFKHNRAETGYTIQEIISKANTLKNLEEGFVGYDSGGVPRVKVKSAQYVALHKLKGDGLTPKRICELVVTGEEDEYLTYFPEDERLVKPYFEAHKRMLDEMVNEYDKVKEIVDQKEFAISIKSVYGNSVLFSARKLSKPVETVYNSDTVQRKTKLLLEYCERNKVCSV